MSSNAGLVKQNSKSEVLKSYKTVLLGDASVGKSSLVIRLVKNVFLDNMETTIGASFFTHTLDVDNKRIKLEIWDTAGQERFSSLAPMYYRGASAAIIVFDQCNIQSFERAQSWIQQLQLSGRPNIVIALAANKMDLPTFKVNPQESRAYAENNGLLYIQTSAKTGQNVQQLFTILAQRLTSQDAVSSRHLDNNQTLKIISNPTNNASDDTIQSRSTCC